MNIIKKYFMKRRIKSLEADLVTFEETKAKLVYKPLPSEITDKLDQYEKIEKKIKKTKKKIKKLNKELDEGSLHR